MDIKVDVAPLRGFIAQTEAITKRLSDKAPRNLDLGALRALTENFKRKTDDFFRDERKLNIGVVGQVKAGKSSFLNALLFGGKDVLPKASTPKTATLTKMEYADENAIEVEYYSADEWSVIEDNAKIDSDDDIYTSAKELVRMVRDNRINPRELTEKKTERILFGSYEELLGRLNGYVGEDGQYTPLVKSVRLYLHNEAFQGLSIVDTPGLNDPIASRTLRTKEFMELCDVVFFLSQSSSFLDQNDWTLLSTQLPQKGVKRLVLIASKYDSGVRDVLRLPTPDDDLFGGDDTTASNIPDACQLVRKKLKKRAKQQVERYVKDLQSRNVDSALIDVVRGCADPILVSSMACNMARKSTADYSPEENNVYGALRRFSKDIQADLRRLGNMEQVENIFDAVVREKETILREKAAGFVPTATQELKDLLKNFREKTENHIQLLEHGDKETLLARRNAVQTQIFNVKAALTEVFGEVKMSLETQKGEAMRDLRRVSADYASVQSRAGERTEREEKKVWAGIWLFPWTWGRYRTVYEYHTVRYNYCLASDAMENLRQYSLESASRIEKAFSDALKLNELRRNMLTVILNNFDMGDETYNAAFCRLVVEDTVNSIELPVISMDISGALDDIAGEFSGEITSSEEKTQLNSALTHALSSLYNALAEKLETEVKRFRASMDKLARKTQDSLLENINAEFDKLQAEYGRKETEIANYKAYLSALRAEAARL